MILEQLIQATADDGAAAVANERSKPLRRVNRHAINKSGSARWYQH